MPERLDYQARKAGGAALWASTVARWLQRNFTRDNLLQGLKTLASIGPLTVLIWVYAEREEVRHEPDVSISIEVRCNDPRRVVSLKKPYPDKVVVAELEGPPSTLDTVVERLERHSGDQPAVEILIDPLLEPGRVHEINTAESLAKNPIFRGVTITSCEPPQLDVYVDEYKEADLEVQAPVGITNLVGPPVFTPRIVKVRGPKESIDELQKQNKLVAEADLQNQDGMNSPGPHNFSVVRIKPLDDPNLAFSPPDVAAAVSVRESDVTGTIRSVPIWVSGPPDFMASHRVELKNDVVTNVKVTGPKEKIDLVNQPDFSPKPHALLEISVNDEPGKPLERLLTFDLPLGLRVNEELSEQKIGFQLVETKQSGSSENP